MIGLNCFFANNPQGVNLQLNRLGLNEEKIQRFFSQPFFVAEQFTGMAGKYVHLEDTIRGFKEIVEGKHDKLPLQAFYMVGAIDEAIEKAKTISGEEPAEADEPPEPGKADSGDKPAQAE